MKVKAIHHVALIVDNLEKCWEFYTNVLGLQELPAIAFDYPVQHYQIDEYEQLHLTEWEDEIPFRAHFCLEVDDFNAAFYRFKELEIIDTKAWGKVRKLSDGALQMFVRDPSNNLIEISYRGDLTKIDPAIYSDELFETAGVYVSGRNDARGLRA